jgi:hypothetical protein
VRHLAEFEAPVPPSLREPQQHCHCEKHEATSNPSLHATWRSANAALSLTMTALFPYLGSALLAMAGATPNDRGFGASRGDESPKAIGALFG